jgi:hypothetical protein
MGPVKPRPDMSRTAPQKFLARFEPARWSWRPTFRGTPLLSRQKEKAMKNKLIATMAAATATIILAGSASACPHGYKRVKIDGNWGCRIDVLPNNNKLKAKPKPTPPGERSSIDKKLQFQLQEANS